MSSYLEDMMPILGAYQDWLDSDRAERFGQYAFNRGLISQNLDDKHNLFYETDASTVLVRVIEELGNTDD